MKYSFEMALAFLKQGKMVRRAGWVPGLYLLIADGELKMLDLAVSETMLFEAEFDNEDFLAEDWEVVE